MTTLGAARPCLPYPNPAAAANAVKRWSDGHATSPMLVARPWNRFDPYQSQWYLVPSADWPAYRYGKFWFGRSAGGNRLSCSYYVEKGLDPALSAVFPKGRKFIMGKNWLWHHVVSDIESGVFEQAATEVVRLSSQELTLELEGGYIEDPGSYDPQGPRPNWNRLVFGWREGELNLLESDTPDAHLATLQPVKSLTALVRRIGAMEASGWTWIDLRLGLQFDIETSDPNLALEGSPWTVEQLWRRCLEPWMPWVR